MAFFKNLKGKLADTIKDLRLDEDEKAVQELVARATTELLPGPDWGANMEFVDFINRAPSLYFDKATYAMRRNLSKSNPKIQLLTLTLLESCVKNCGTPFHEHLAGSELWEEIKRMALAGHMPPTAAVAAQGSGGGDSLFGGFGSSLLAPSRPSGEVHDRVLALVEDFARGLPDVPTFRRTYERLLDQGVVFPLRHDDDVTSSPPTALYATAASPARLLGGGAAGAMSVAAGNDAVFAGMSPEDRAAVQAAMAEMEAEAAVGEQATHGGGGGGGGAAPASAASTAVRRLAGAFLQPAAATRPSAGGYRPPAFVDASDLQLQPPASMGGLLGDGDQVPAAAQVTDAQADDGGTLLDIGQTSADLLSDLLRGIQSDGGPPGAVGQAHVVEVADTCLACASRVEELLQSASDETLLVRGLAVHEALRAQLATYNALLAAAEPPAAAAAENAEQLAQPAAAVGGGELPVSTTATAVAPAALPPAPVWPAAQLLTIGGEDGVDGATLETRRGAPAVGPSRPPQTAAAPDGTQVDSLLDLGDLPAPAVATAPVPAIPAPTTAQLPHSSAYLVSREEPPSLI